MLLPILLRDPLESCVESHARTDAGHLNVYCNCRPSAPFECFPEPLRFLRRNVSSCGQFTSRGAPVLHIRMTDDRQVIRRCIAKLRKQLAPAGRLGK